jgi:hypothetical protein
VLSLLLLLAPLAGINLGSAKPFCVLGASAVTNTGPSILLGDLGVSPGSAITGFPPGIVYGTTHIADAAAQQAQVDATIAYATLAALSPTQDLTGQDLGGLTLLPGVYHFSSSAQLTGVLTLDTLGDPGALFVFQIGSTLTTASGSSILVKHSRSACAVYWQVGSSATLGTGSALVGTIIASQDITLTSAAKIHNGRAIARNGAVTMGANSINRSGNKECGNL